MYMCKYFIYTELVLYLTYKMVIILFNYAKKYLNDVFGDFYGNWCIVYKISCFLWKLLMEIYFKKKEDT